MRYSCRYTADLVKSIASILSVVGWQVMQGSSYYFIHCSVNRIISVYLSLRLQYSDRTEFAVLRLNRLITYTTAA